MEKLKFVLIGAGMRGQDHTMHACRDHGMECVAVADPSDSRRNFIRDTYGVKEEMCFTDYKPLFALGKIADVALIATMDRDHFVPTMKAIDLGYNLLLEKPIAPTPEECIAITKAANEKSIAMIKAKELLPLTGYVHGGCSPVGMKKQFKTFIHYTVEDFDTFYFSAGKIGYQVETTLKELAKIIPFELSDITEQ